MGIVRSRIDATDIPPKLGKQLDWGNTSPKVGNNDKLMKTFDNFKSKQNYDLLLGLIDEMKTATSDRAIALRRIFSI